MGSKRKTGTGRRTVSVRGRQVRRRRENKSTKGKSEQSHESHHHVPAKDVAPLGSSVPPQRALAGLEAGPGSCPCTGLLHPRRDSVLPLPRPDDCLTLVMRVRWEHQALPQAAHTRQPRTPCASASPKQDRRAGHTVSRKAPETGAPVPLCHKALGVCRLVPVPWAWRLIHAVL